MQFEITVPNQAELSNSELSELLNSVYVGEGYTPSELAQTLFAPSRVRERGVLFTARAAQSHQLAGMIIVVPHYSQARVMAKDNECEMHLLGVEKEFRGFGLGRLLVDTALQYAESQEWSKMVLWTQTNMIAAHHLYESCGFTQAGEMLRNDMSFIIYEKHL